MNHLVVNLEEPIDCSTHNADKIAVCGWILAPRTISQKEITKDLKIEVLLGEGNLNLEHQPAIVGQRLGFQKSDTKPYVEAFNLSAIGRPIEKAGYEEYLSYDFEGLVNVSAIAQAGEGRQLQLALRASLHELIGISNTSDLVLADPEMFSKPFGGLYSPDTNSLSSNVLLIEGWALAAEDEIVGAKVFLNEVFVADANTPIASEKCRLKFPTLTNSDSCMFRALLFREDILAKGISLNNSVSIRVEVIFASGKTLPIEKERFSWTMEKESKEEVEGGIETLRITEDKRVEIAGWVFSKDQAKIKLILEGRKAKVVPAKDNIFAFINWYAREDIENRFFSNSLKESYGFSIKLDAALFGKAPGEIRLIAEYSGEKIEIGEHADWKRLSSLVGECAGVTGVTKIASKMITNVTSVRVGATPRGRPVAKGAPTGLTMKRLLFCSHNFSATEGAPKVFRDVILNAKKQDPKADILVISPKDGPLRVTLEEQGVKTAIIEGLGVYGQTPERYYSSLRSFLAIARGFSPTLIYANVLDSFWAIDGANRLGVESLWLIHESVDPLETFSELSPKLRMLFLNRLNSVSKLLFVTKKTSDLFLPYLKHHRISVLRNGVDIETISKKRAKKSPGVARKAIGLSESEVVISIIGTTTRRKGQDIFLQEMARVKNKHRDKRFKFLVVGARPGAFLDSLYQDVTTLGLERDVLFVPENPNISNYFIASDILVIASREEAAPLVSLEAFAYGVPLVSTTVFGLAEQIKNEKNALTFDINKPGELASQVERLLNNSLLVASITKTASKDVAEKYALDKTIADHWQIISAIGKN